MSRAPYEPLGGLPRPHRKSGDFLPMLVLGVAIVSQDQNQGWLFLAAVAAGVGLSLGGYARHRARAAAPRPAALPPAVPRRGPSWSEAHERFGRLRMMYAAYECDPVLVLRLPALADVTVPSTARFVAAFAEATALDTERQPPPEHARRFIAAVEQAQRCWVAAWQAAQRGEPPSDKR